MLSKLTVAAAFIFQALTTTAQTRESKLIYLDTISARHGFTRFNGQDHYHPVDRKAILLYDSLKKTGIDTLLIYRHWLGANGFNGYGKVLWLDKGVLKQYRINFINEYPRYGIKSVQYAVLKQDTIFSFFFKNKIDTVTANPEKQEIWMSHDSQHFVYLQTKNSKHSFNIEGLLVRYNPEHLRSKFVNKLMIEALQYISEVYKK